MILHVANGSRRPAVSPYGRALSGLDRRRRRSAAVWLRLELGLVPVFRPVPASGYGPGRGVGLRLPLRHPLRRHG
jgi:hypothetical protein